MLAQPEPVHRTADSYQPQPEDPGPLRAAHTANFPALLGELGAMLGAAGMRSADIKAGCGKCGACSSLAGYEKKAI